MVPTYSLMGPFRGHTSLKSSPFSPGPSCKLSDQYLIQDHMAAHYKKLTSAKSAVDSSAPKSLHTSIKYKDQQKRDRLIQALEKYKKDLLCGLPASPFNSRSVSPGQQKARWSLLEDGHLYLTSGWKNCSRTRREQHLPSVQKLTSKALLSASTTRNNTQNRAQHALSQTPVHNSGIDRSSVSPLQQSHMQLGSSNRKKAFQNSFNKTGLGNLLNKHSIYFTENKKCFTPKILKTSHQSFLVKQRYYNPPPQKKISPGRPSLKSAGVNDEKRRELPRFLEDAHVRPHTDHFSQQPVENHELWIPSLEILLSPGSQLEEKEKEEYLPFLQEITNDILIRNCYHKENVVYQCCEQQFMADRQLDNLNTRQGEKSSTKAERRVFSTIGKDKVLCKKEKNSSKPEERAKHHKPTGPFHQLKGCMAKGHQHSCNILLTYSFDYFREHSKLVRTANEILHQLQSKPWTNRKTKK